MRLREASSLICGLLLLIAWALPVAPASAATGYEPDAVKPQISIGSQFPHGIAIDQTSQHIYVAIYLQTLSVNPSGEVIHLLADGTPAADSPFGAGPSALFSGVAVNPLTHDVYASRSFADTPFGDFGEARMHRFSSVGSPLASFALNNPEPNIPQIATDSSGRVYYPNPSTHAVEVFDSTGALQSTITCGDCPGGPFDAPASVAVDAGNNLYVVDLDRDFVVKLKQVSGSFTFERLLQSGRGAGAVAVDSGTGDVFVGDLPGGTGYHIVAYDSAGNQFDDFAAGMVGSPPAEAGRMLTPQIAVNATTHDLYVGDQSRLVVFERTTIDPPTAATDAPSPVGQLKATLKATVNAHGHAVLECEFQYTDHADFQANEYANAVSIPCPSKPNTATATPLSTTLSGLSPATTYHYRVIATSNAGSAQGSDRTFTTMPVVPPAVTTQPATGVGQTGATLIGKVNPQGGSVSDCYFEYGTSTAYGVVLPCASLPGAVTAEVAQSRIISTGLTPSTTYHYRLVVTSNAGTAKGGDVAFTTATPPPPPPPPPDPPPAGEPSSPGTGAPPVSIPTQPAPAPAPAPKPLRCKKGFQKKKVRGKLRCVKKPKKRRAKRTSRQSR